MKKLLLLAAATALALAVGCGGGGQSAGFGFAKLRMIHLSSGAGNVDFAYRDEALGTAVPYSQARPAAGEPGQLLDTGDGTLSARTFGAGAATFTRSLTLESDRIYSAVFTGVVGETGTDAPRFIVTSDVEADLPRNRFSFRLLHAALDEQAVDFYLTAENETIADRNPTVSNLSRYGVSPLVAATPGTVRFWVTPVGSKTPIFNGLVVLDEGVYAVVSMVQDGGGPGLAFLGHGAPLDVQ